MCNVQRTKMLISSVLQNPVHIYIKVNIVIAFCFPKEPSNCLLPETVFQNVKISNCNFFVLTFSNILTADGKSTTLYCCMIVNIPYPFDLQYITILLSLLVNASFTHRCTLMSGLVGRLITRPSYIVTMATQCTSMCMTTCPSSTTTSQLTG